MTTQHDYVIANQSHTAFRADLNDALLAIASQNSGASAPGTTYAYQLWADTTNALWKIRDSTNSSWLVIGPIAPTQAVQRSYLGVDAPTVSCSVGSSALTIALKTAAGADASSALPLSIAFRSATLSSGAINVRTLSAALSVVISSGSTLGAASGVARPLYVYAIDNAGTVELGVSASYFGMDFVGSSTAEGGAGAADAVGVIYSTTARSSVAMKLIAVLTDSQATAGTYAAVPTAVKYPSAAAPAPTSTAFHAKDAASTTTSAEAATYATEVVDLGNNFNPTTGRYTAPVAGTYQFNFTVQGNTAAGKGCTGYLQVNGAGTLYGTTAVASPTTTYSLATNPYSTGSVILTLAAGDYVSAFVSVTGAAACNVTAFSGYLLQLA